MLAVCTVSHTSKTSKEGILCFGKKRLFGVFLMWLIARLYLDCNCRCGSHLAMNSVRFARLFVTACVQGMHTVC